MTRCEGIQLDVLSMLSHELRTPLTSIKGYTGMLANHDKQISQLERQEFLQAILQASNRIENVVEELFKFQQLQYGSLSLVKENVDLLQLIRQGFTVAEQHVQEKTGWIPGTRTYSEQKEILFSITLNGASVPLETEALEITADYQLLGLALSKLLENALLYSFQGGSIEVSIQNPAPAEEVRGLAGAPQEGSAAGMLAICVRDHGIGIAQEDQAQVFDCFKRVDMSLTRQNNGLGLGLHITKKIIELHHGSINVESQENKGCVFHILLPLTQPPERT